MMKSWRPRSLMYAAASLGLVSLMVACGTDGDRVPVTPGRSSPVISKIQECTKSVQSKTVDGEQKVEICHIADEKKGLGESKKSDVRYRIRREDRKSQDKSSKSTSVLSLRVLVDFSGTSYVDGSSGARAISAIRMCQSRIEKIFERTGHLRLDLEFLSSLNADTDIDNGETDQTLSLIDKPGAGDTRALVMRQWPERTDLYPFGLTGDGQCPACKEMPYGREKISCLRSCIAVPSEPFCRNLAKLVGHWVGLADETSANLCLEAKGARPPGETEGFMRGWVPGDKLTASGKTDKAKGDETQRDEAALIVEEGSAQPSGSAAASAGGGTAEPSGSATEPTGPSAPSDPVAQPLVQNSNDWTMKMLEQDPFWRASLSPKDIARILRPACPSMPEPDALLRIESEDESEASLTGASKANEQ